VIPCCADENSIFNGLIMLSTYLLLTKSPIFLVSWLTHRPRTSTPAPAKALPPGKQPFA